MTGSERTDDELVSAVLDGEATDAEAAQVAASPHLQARLASFRAVRTGLAPDDDDHPGDGRDERVLAALSAWSGDEDAIAPTTGDGVTALDGGRARRARSLRWVAAAAAAVVVVVGAAVALRPRTESSDLASESITTTSLVPSGSTPDAAEAKGARSDTAAAAPTAELVDLGSFATIDALRSAVPDPASTTTAAAAQVPAGAASGSTTAGARAADVSCHNALAALGAAPVATATVSGTPVVVGRSATGLVVLTTAGCTPL